MNTYRGRPKLYPVKEIRDQVYSFAGGKARLADLYLAQVPSDNVPVIIWVHGGGWRFGDRHLAPDLSQFFAARGFAMVSFDYRLSDEATFPGPVEDMKTVIRWIRSLAHEFNLDAEKIGLWGSSAGGHLAACAALSGEGAFLSAEHAGFPSAVQAVVDGYGPTDLSRIDADRPPPGSQPVDVESVAVPNLLPAGHPDSFESRFLGSPVGTSPASVAIANPISYVQPGAPPFLILHGIHDPLIPCQQSRLLFEALSSAGNDAVLLTIERLGHGFFNTSTLDFIDPGAITVFASLAATSFEKGTALPKLPFGFDLIEAFFRQHLTV